MDKPTDEWITLHPFITSQRRKKQKQKQMNESTNLNEME